MCDFVGWCGLTQEAQAAWAQAILSVLAILAAAAFPMLSERARTRERIRVYLSIVGLAHMHASRDTWNLKQRLQSLANPEWNTRHWARALRMFEQLQHQDVPDSDLISVLDDAHDAVLRFSRLWETVIAKAAQSYAISDFDVAEAEKCHATIETAFRNTVRIGRRYEWPSPIARIRYFLFIRQIRKDAKRHSKE